MTPRPLTSLFLLTALLHGAAAQVPDFIFDHYSTDEGLPHNSISDIHQDSKGYIWASTWNGLSRFDGNSFVAYTIRPGDRTNLSHNRILSIDEDKAGYFWLTTYDNRLYRFDSVQESFVAVPDDLDGFDEDNLKVSCFHNDSRSDTWVSIPGQGLFKVGPDLAVRRISGAGLSKEEATSIYESSSGDIYAVSSAGLVAVTGDEAGLLYKSPSPIIGFEEMDGRLHFLSETELVTLDAPSGGKVSVTDLKTYGEATSIVSTGPDGSKELYIGFKDNAIGLCDPQSGAVTLRNCPMGRVRSLFPDPEGLLWISTDRTGIWTWDPSTKRFKHHEHSRNVMSYYSDTLANVVSKDGFTWVKMNNYGFGYYDRRTEEVVPLGNVKEQEGWRFMNGVACFEPGPSGILWFSTIQRGLDRVMVINPKVEILRPPTVSDDVHSSAEIRAMLRDSKGFVWVAAKSRELYRYSPDLEECRRFPDRESGDIGVVYSIFEDAHGRIWLGTKGDGLLRMTPDEDGEAYTYRRWRHDESRPSSLSSDNIYSIAEDSRGRIWLATFGGGLSLLEDPDGEEFRTVHNGLQDYPMDFADRARTIHRMQDGTMLVGTVGGLVWFDPSEEPPLFHLERKVPGDRRSLGGNDIIQIFSDDQGGTYLCTFGGGLNKIVFEDGTPVFDIVCQEDGLASDIVLSGTGDRSGSIWMTTESGISKLDTATGSLYNYTRYDGIVPTTFSEATCAVLEDGSLLFGSLGGLYRLDPASFGFEPDDCSLIVSGVRVDGERVPLTGRILVPHDYSSVRMEFASLNSRMRSGLAFSYKLEGYDKDWIPAGENRSVAYSRIPPGVYTFKVKSLSSYDPDDVHIVSQDLKVAAAPWSSPLAKSLYALVALSVLLFLARMLVVQVKLRNDIRLEQDLGKVKARFFTNISHELRTPLTLILGGIDDISKSVSQANEYSVNLVYRNAKRMMTLVNQLLDIRKIVDGKMRLKVKQLDIVDLVRRVHDDFKEISSERRIELRLAHSADSLLVWGDELRLEALVYNLVSNAFKFTPDGGRVEVGLFHREGERDFTIMVKDNGIGIPKEKQAVIFEPFVQAADTVLKGAAGSGIGLSFCKEITDLHGGRIWVESRKGEGSEFYVELPVERDRFSEETAEFLEANEADSSAEVSYGLSKYRLAPAYPKGALKVMVVEDNAELRVFLYNNLIGSYEVRDASNGQEALDLIAQGWTPDLILTDLMMPVMDGIGLINAVRGNFAVSHIPIILFTAKFGDDTHLQAMRFGADAYIAKPFTIDLLLARIDNLLERRRRILARFAPEPAVSKAQSGKVEIVPEEFVITDRDEALIKKVMRWLEDNVADPEVTVDQLATHVGMGRTSMYNKIKGLTGKSPVELIQSFRIEKAVLYLKSGQFSVSETSYKVGFSDPGYFSRAFKKSLGVTPADYMRRHAPNRRDPSSHQPTTEQ